MFRVLGEIVALLAGTDGGSGGPGHNENHGIVGLCSGFCLLCCDVGEVGGHFSSQTNYSFTYFPFCVC